MSHPTHWRYFSFGVGEKNLRDASVGIHKLNCWEKSATTTTTQPTSSNVECWWRQFPVNFDQSKFSTFILPQGKEEGEAVGEGEWRRRTSIDIFRLVSLFVLFHKRTHDNTHLHTKHNTTHCIYTQSARTHNNLPFFFSSSSSRLIAVTFLL